MGIITLTTDLGDKDFYQAALKGSILKLLPTVNIVDITHTVAAYNIQQGAFILKNSYYYFPDETVHLIGIDTVYSVYTRYLALKHESHYFVGADNGIFSLMFKDEPGEVFEIDIKQDLKFLHFPVADIFVKAACHLAGGGALQQIGIPVSNLEQKMNLQPVIEKNLIKGVVIYIDSFQNVITNITKDFFNTVQQGRRFTLSFKRNETINHLSWHYNEVPEGEKLCLFGISDHLEIAINKGNAAGLLGLNLGDSVIIDFFEHMRTAMLLSSLLIAVAGAAAPHTDSVVYQLQRNKINAMLARRSLKFGRYDQSLGEHTGIFGLQTKKDIRRSNDILMDIVQTDNDIYKELKILLDYRAFQQGQVQSRADDDRQVIISFMNTINKLRQQIDELKDVNNRQLRRQKAVRKVFILTAIVMLALISLLIFRSRRR